MYVGQSAAFVSPPRKYLKCTMTTCYAQPDVPAAKQKGLSPVNDQQQDSVCVHLFLKCFTAPAAPWKHKLVGCMHVSMHVY